MTQEWTKKGLIFDGISKIIPDYDYVSLPTPIFLENNKLRIYFSSRNKNNISSIFFLDLLLDGYSYRILRVEAKPVLKPGKSGFFDDCGVTPSCVIKINGCYYLYYTGWNKQVTIPFQTYCGVAKLSDNLESADKLYLTPILDRSNEEPFSVGACFVSFSQEKNQYLMWYESCTGYEEISSSHNFNFSINCASSSDGFNWNRENIKCLEPQREENIVARPFVLNEDNLYKMWFCNKADGQYSISYAESLDGQFWSRRDNSLGLNVSQTGWDSDQVCYPYIFKHREKKYMLYNGNGYGKTGFGIAVLESK